MKDSLKKSIAGLLVASCVTMGAFASGQSEIAASGNMGSIAQGYELIDDITVKGISDFTMVQGDSYSISVEGDQAYLETLGLSNEDGFLQIDGSNAGALSVVITTPSFATLFLDNVSEGEISGFTSKSDLLIKLNGFSDLVVKELLNAPNVRIIANSKSSIEGEIETSSLDVRTTGSATATLKGVTELFNVNMSQKSTGNFDGLHVQKAEVFTRNDATISAAIPGMSLVKVTTTNDSSVDLAMNGVLTANVRGDSSLAYSGNIRWAGQDVDEDASITAN
jgi:hypothetical protein